jgi:hypothetical protein
MLKEKHDRRMEHMAELFEIRKQVVAKEAADAREAEQRRARREGDRHLDAIVSVVNGDMDQARELLGATPRPPPSAELQVIRAYLEALPELLKGEGELAIAALKASGPLAHK